MPSPAGRPSRRPVIKAVLAALAVLSGVLVGTVAATPAAAVDYSGFRPGNIISDAVFFDHNAMNDDQIQAFLNSKVRSCTAGYTCLKDFTEVTQSRPADAYCRAYSGGQRERAATIIGKVARACGINPRVLVVTLQKEQGLVTNQAPTATRYQRAMGFACPDTGGCDERYYGFFNQVYSAAHRFKEYELSGRFTYYGPRRTVSIRYHPNAACGASNVYVENQATANLYYYTPYQPNRAALAAGAGASTDPCATYGNRNFYRYFTEWFGTTQGPTPALVRTSSNSTVYLVDGQQRFHVPSLGDYHELAAVLGSVQTVSQSFIDGLTARPATGLIFRESSGRILMVQGGSVHRFPSCEVLALWGGNCSGGYSDVSTALFARARVGAEMSEYFAVAGTPVRGKFLGGGRAQPYGDAQDANVYAGRTVGWVGTISQQRFDGLTRLPFQFAPGRLIKSSAAPEVYLTAGTNQLHRIANFGVAADFGRARSTMRTVPSAHLSGYSRREDLLRPVASCGAQTYLAASGRMHPVTDVKALHDGAVPAWDAFTCQQYGSGGKLTAPALVKGPGTADVWAVQAMKRRPIYSWADAQRITNSSNPPVAVVDGETLASWPVGMPALVEPALIKGGAPSVWAVVGADARMHVPSFALAREWGYAGAHFVLPDSAVAQFRDVGTPLSWWVRCGSENGRLAVAASGRLFTTSARGAAGFATPVVPQALCDATPAGPQVDRVFVKDASSSKVYLGENGRLRWVSSWSAVLAANGGKAPELAVVGPATIASVPQGPTLS